MMTPSESDLRIRSATFAFLREQVSIHGEVLPWRVLQAGFSFGQSRIPLVARSGIFAPSILEGLPLTIRTKPRIEGQVQRYDDRLDQDDNLLYSYMTRDDARPEADRDHAHNRALRAAMTARVPLVYLYGVDEGEYIPEWPVYVIRDDQVHFEFTIAMMDRDVVNLDATAVERVMDKSYSTASVLHRAHQRSFSQKLRRAYAERCAVCRLRHLLDAAHILPDRDLRSEPRVSHGILLCKLHHGAYDGNLMGITRDFGLVVRRDILSEPDGPVLEHGLREFNGKLLRVPRSDALKPNREFLAERYSQFERNQR
jgi:putative restriction endonuclease